MADTNRQASAQKPVLFITGADSGMDQLAVRWALADGWKGAVLDVNGEGLALEQILATIWLCG